MPLTQRQSKLTEGQRAALDHSPSRQHSANMARSEQLKGNRQVAKGTNGRKGLPVTATRPA